MNPKEVKYMAKRRPAGDGMVRKRDDGRWEGRIVIGHRAVSYTHLDVYKRQVMTVL